MTSDGLLMVTMMAGVILLFLGITGLVLHRAQDLSTRFGGLDDEMTAQLVKMTI